MPDPARGPTARHASAQQTTARRTTLLTAALCYLVAALEGLDLQAAGVAAPKLAPAMGLSSDQLGWFFSASTFGLMLGAAIGGRLSDRFGRKAVLVASVVVFGLLSLATAFSPNLEILVLTRFLTGVGLGGALPNLVALVVENAPPERKNAAVGLLYAGLPTGGATASLISLLGRHDNWQEIFVVGGVAPLVAAPVLALLLPDSRQQADAKATEGALRPAGVAFTLLGEGRAARTLLLWLGFFLALLTFYLLLNWLPTLLIGRGLPRPDAALVQLAFNVMGALASIVTGRLMDRADLRTMTTATFLLAIGSLILLAVTPAHLTACLLSGAIVGGAMSATQALLYAVTPANYPTAIRGTGVGAAVAVGRLGSAAGPLLAGALLGVGRTPREVLTFMAPTMLLSALAIVLLAALMARAQRALHA
jgi:AAHS family 3-hydroxyphenylpropionic acid transporter